MKSKELILFYVFSIGTFAILMSLRATNQIDTAQFITSFVTSILLIVTAIYAVRTADIAKATKEQAKATIKMAEEMKEQRIMASRPIIIQKAVNKEEYLFQFEISSIGNNPATEVTYAIMDQDVLAIPGVGKETYLRTNDPPIKFRPSMSNMFNIDKNKRYQLICQYQDIFSNYPEISFHQTCLPFKITKSDDTGKVGITVGKMELSIIPKIKLNEFYYSKVKFND